MITALSFLFILSVPSVQANESEDQPDWRSLLEGAHILQDEYTREAVEYPTIRKDFLEVFTKEAMMSIFMEHMMIHEELYSLAATDFSPYMIPSLEWTDFHIVDSNKEEIVLLENEKEVTELRSPQKISRKVTLSLKDEGWRISHLDWEVQKNQEAE